MATPFDIANFNLTNFADNYNNIFDSTPADVNINVKDSNGNITTKTVANRGKFKQQLWDDVGGALGQFNRTFYVDAVNGDDNNIGNNSSAPFKTIKKAVDSVPVGGIGRIYLIGSGDNDNPTTFTFLSGNVNITRKNITILSYNEGCLLKPYITNSSTYNYVHGFDIGSYGFLYIYTNANLTIETALKSDSSLNFHWYSSGFINVKGAGSVYIGGYPVANDVRILNDGCNLINICVRDTNGGFASISSAYAKYIFDSTTPNAYIFSVYSSAGNIAFAAYNVLLVDTAGDNVAYKDACSGIVKDANGVPRNIISNIVF